MTYTRGFAFHCQLGAVKAGYLFIHSFTPFVFIKVLLCTWMVRIESVTCHLQPLSGQPKPGFTAHLVPYSSSWSLPHPLSSPDTRGRGSGPSLQMENVINNNKKNIQEEETRKTTWGRLLAQGRGALPWASGQLRPPSCRPFWEVAKGLEF